jgi:SrtB family sortase
LPPKHRKYAEDDFDLEQFRRTQAREIWLKALMEKSRKIIRALRIVIVVLAFIVAYLAFNVISYYMELLNTKMLTEKARNISLDISSYESPKDPNATPYEDPAPKTGMFEPAPGWEDAVPAADATPTPRPILESMAALRQEFENEDIIAYVKIPGTRIDFPVVQGPDNEFYLTRDFTRKESVTGAAFMDFRCQMASFGRNTVIYAHNMRDGSMFHDLRSYRDKAFFASHPLILLTTLFEETEWEVFSFYSTDTAFDYIQTDFDSPESFYERLLLPVKEKSLYDTGVDVSMEDRVLSLSTCTNTGEEMRYALHARLKG